MSSSDLTALEIETVKQVLQISYLNIGPRVEKYRGDLL